MTLTRWNPLREMEDLFETFARRPALRGDGGQENVTLADWAPRVDISESEEEYLIKAELPGIDKKDLKVTVNDGVLTLQGERKAEREEKDRKYHRVERSYGSFARCFTLPDNVDEKSIRAEHKDGLLYLHLGKTEEAKPKSIEVKVA
jgi:HSP20 family protein